MPFLKHIHLPLGLEWRGILAGTALFTAGLIVRGFLLSPTKTLVLESPRKTLVPKLSAEEIQNLPYPLDAYPGARDVETPYGSIRVYEFGPEDGPKVLLVHGISTPCLTLGGIAQGLVDKGCRVMLFDLPGRGYSDAPSDLKHDMRAMSSYILLVLSSSPLSWTGSSSGRFSLIGYSLGGGISMGFAAYFPHLISSLVLIAPAGLIRDHHFSRTSRILYSEGVIPEPILDRLVRRRLQKPMYPPKEQPKQDEKTGAETAVQAEVNIEGNQQVILSKAHPDVSIERVVTHQVINHSGFVNAFMSSIRYGPIQRQHKDWNRVGKRLSNAKGKSTFSEENVLIVLGRSDPIIHMDELKADATETLEGNVVFKIIEAGHEAPVTKPEETIDYIWSFWHDESAK